MAIRDSAGSELYSLEAVADQGFLARLSPDLVEQLAEFGQEVRYPAGTIIAAPRGRRSAAIVISGALRYYLTSADGRQVTIRYIGPGGLVGTVVREESNNAGSVEVLSPSLLLHIDVEQMRALAGRRPDLAEALLDDAVSRLRASYRTLAARAFTTVQARVARDLLDRASIDGPLRAGMHLGVTQQSLADAIGSAREVVARALGRLRRQGVVASRRDGITILDPAALRCAAGDVT